MAVFLYLVTIIQLNRMQSVLKFRVTELRDRSIEFVEK